MTTSRSWTLFSVSATDARPMPGHPGLRAQPLVANIDPTGSSLLGLWYESNARDDARRHAVGQVGLVLEGELLVDGQRCGPGAGWFAPAGCTYAIEAGRDGATAVEFRPAPVVYGTRRNDDATMVVKRPTPPDPAYGWATMQAAGPVTSAHEFTYFDIHAMPERQVGDDLWIQALVNHADDDGQSMLMVRHRANSVVPPHSHDVDQIVLVLEGSIFLGNRAFGPGAGFFTPKGKRYGLRAGADGTVRVEWRPSPLRFATDWVESER